jgi:uncharacterized membrane protein (DUF106 family)
MANFQTKYSNFGFLLKPLEWVFWYILCPFGIRRPFGVFNSLLVYFVVSLVYFFPLFGLMHQENSGTSGLGCHHQKWAKFRWN